MHYVHKKARCRPEIANFRTKTLHFLRLIRLNWLAQIELSGTRRSCSLILLISYTVVSEKCQKETETEETISFFVTFLSLVKFQLGGGPAPSPLAYAYAPSEENKKSVRKFSARFLSFSNEISTAQKIVLSSSRGQEIFEDLRLRGQGQGLQNVFSRTSSRTPPVLYIYESIAPQIKIAHEKT